MAPVIRKWFRIVRNRFPSSASWSTPFSAGYLANTGARIFKGTADDFRLEPGYTFSPFYTRFLAPPSFYRRDVAAWHGRGERANVSPFQ
jgi:hypothetical protein